LPQLLAADADRYRAAGGVGLAEATARTSEIPDIVVSDLDSSIESGFPERFVTEQVGHAWGSTTSIYCSVSDDKNRVLQKAIASAFRRPGEGDKP